MTWVVLVGGMALYVLWPSMKLVWVDRQVLIDAIRLRLRDPAAWAAAKAEVRAENRRGVA